MTGDETADAFTVDTALRELAARVERNVPHHREPERFHTEKSEIAAALRRLASSQPRRRARFFRATVSP